MTGQACKAQPVTPILVFCLRESGLNAQDNYSPQYTVMYRTSETYWEPWIPGEYSQTAAEALLKNLLNKRAFEKDYLGVIK
jgi:hypothetical protein